MGPSTPAEQQQYDASVAHHHHHYAAYVMQQQQQQQQQFLGGSHHHHHHHQQQQQVMAAAPGGYIVMMAPPPHGAPLAAVPHAMQQPQQPQQQLVYASMPGGGVPIGMHPQQQQQQQQHAGLTYQHHHHAVPQHHHMHQQAFAPVHALAPSPAVPTAAVATMPPDYMGAGSKPTKPREATPPPPPAAAGDTEPGPRQLIVNYLPADATDAELHQLFVTVGPVEVARIVHDKVTGRAKGFGFVYFKKCDDAMRATRTMTGYPLRGKRLKVSFAVPQRPMRSLFAEQGLALPAGDDNATTTISAAAATVAPPNKADVPLLQLPGASGHAQAPHHPAGLLPFATPTPMPVPAPSPQQPQQAPIGTKQPPQGVSAFDTAPILGTFPN